MKTLIGNKRLREKHSRVTNAQRHTLIFIGFTSDEIDKMDALKAFHCICDALDRPMVKEIYIQNLRKEHEKQNFKQSVPTSGPLH